MALIQPTIIEFHGDKGEPGYELLHPPKGLKVQNYPGKMGDRSQITRNETGTIPTSAIADLKGASGELPGEHRTRKGAEWDAFLEDIRINGIQNPIFITVDPGKDPVISEGNHRRDAAVALGLPEVPVQIRYFGHAEWDEGGSVLERAENKGKISLDDRTLRMGLDNWKGDPFPLHTKAPDILNETPIPEDAPPSYRSDRASMASILNAIHDWGEPQPEMMRGVRKKNKTIEEMEEEFAEGKKFTLGPRGFSTDPKIAKRFARIGATGTSVVFVLEDGAKGLAIEALSMDDENYTDDDAGEAERITAGEFEVTRVERHTFYPGANYVVNHDPKDWLMIYIRQIGYIKRPEGGFK